MPNHFAAKGAIYYVAIEMVIFSQVKKEQVIFTCKDVMFLRESSPGISLVFI